MSERDIIKEALEGAIEQVNHSIERHEKQFQRASKTDPNGRPLIAHILRREKQAVEQCQAALAAHEAREKRERETDTAEDVAQWMIQQGFSTGHGPTLQDLLLELEWQIDELRARGTLNHKEES